MTHYNHGALIDPEAEHELRAWAFGDDFRGAAEFGPEPIWRLRDEPLLSVDDYAEWHGMAPSREEFRD